MRTVRPFLLLSALASCSSSPAPATGIDAGPSDTGPGMAGDGSAATDSGTPGLPGDYYCAPVSPMPTCRVREAYTCGVCVPQPTPPTVLARTRCDDTTLREYCDPAATPGAPHLGCFNPATPPGAGASQMVTMWGNVHPFGNGNDSQHIRVSVYRIAADRTPMDPPIGTAVSDITAPGHSTEDVRTPSGDMVQFTRNLGGYQIPNVPTEVELLVVTEGDPTDSTAHALWQHRLYDYNIVLHDSDVMAPPAGVMGTMAVQYQPRVLATSDWSSIQSAATLVTGIPAGHGVIAGEIHDCDDVRLANATVSSTPRLNFSAGTVYFSENDTNPLPDMSRMFRGTSLLGTYALLDVTPGLATVAAAGYDTPGHLVHLGSETVRVYPDAVSAVTLRGVRPWQVPAH